MKLLIALVIVTLFCSCSKKEEGQYSERYKCNECKIFLSSASDAYTFAIDNYIKLLKTRNEYFFTLQKDSLKTIIDNLKYPPNHNELDSIKNNLNSFYKEQIKFYKTNSTSDKSSEQLSDIFFAENKDLIISLLNSITFNSWMYGVITSSEYSKYLKSLTSK